MSVRGTVERRENAIVTRHRPLPSTTFQPTAEKGLAFGYATLDGASQIVDAQIPAEITRDTELAAAVNVAATTAARGTVKVDHDSAGNPIALTSAGHGAAADPHTQYQKESEKGSASGYASLDGSGTVPDAQIPSTIARDSEVATAITDHVALADPHTQYQRESEKGAASGYASLNGASKVVETALSADLLATPRNIGGAPFNGSNNIEPGTSGPTASTTMSRNASGGTSVVKLTCDDVQFPSTKAPSADANSLDWYDERNGTPTDVSGAGLTLVGPASSSEVVGRLLICRMILTYPATANGSNAKIGGLPFTVGGSAHDTQAFITYSDATAGVLRYAVPNSGAATVSLYADGGAAVTNAQLSGKTIYITVITRI